MADCGFKKINRVKNNLFYTSDRAKYKFYRNKIIYLTRLSKANYYQSFFDLNICNTLFFFYKNLFYKNVEAEIDPNFKNVLRTFLRLRVD